VTEEANDVIADLQVYQDFFQYVMATDI